MSKFSLSHYRLLTGDMGKLYPCGLVEVLPGDVFNHSASAMVRLSPMAAPIMHPIQARVDHFFIPHRLSWPDDYPTTWEDFITGGPNNDEANPLPNMQTTGVASDLLDYLGLPTVPAITVSSLPVRAANLVFNEFYRDQDLVAERADEATDVANIAWEKDYFTTARPWSQKGPDVTLPLGNKAPVIGLGQSDQTFAGGGGNIYETGASAPRTYASSDDVASGGWNVEEDPANPGFPGIFADLTSATAAKVLEIRRAFALQRFAEARARWGSRYAEYTRHAFGTVSPDARIQRPEFLGRGSARVSVSEVLQTAPDDSTDPRFGVADMYGHGIASGSSNAYRTKFREHGYVMSFFSVRPKQIFTQGIERTWLRADREDFYQRELSAIGQQQVLEQEVYADGTNKDEVFGYSDRYQEYRTQRSLAVGEFRTTLDYWHLGREFQAAPSLNSTFVECDPSKRIFNEQTAHSLWVAINHRLVARRKMQQMAVGRLF